MKYIFLFFIISICSCHQVKKPFIIIDKGNFINDGVAYITYQDSTGWEYSFYDSAKLYHIGQVIK